VALAVGVYILAVPGVTTKAGTQDEGLSFDVATVRDNGSGGQGITFELLRGGRLRIRNHTLKQLVARAHERDFRQILEGPDWIDSDRFDIEATFDGPEVESRVRVMLRNLLADRFALRVRIEERESRYYALALANPSGRLGGGIRRSTVDCDEYYERLERNGPPTVEPTGPYCGLRFRLNSGSGAIELGSGGVTMGEFAGHLQQFVGGLVQDESGLTGPFDIDLAFRPDPSAFGFGVGFGTSSTEGPSIFEALEQQLGLRLEGSQGPVEMLVVEHVERPSPN